MKKEENNLGMRIIKLQELSKKYKDIITASLGIGTLIAFIWVSINQNQKTREALDITKISTEYDLRAYIQIHSIGNFKNIGVGKKPYLGIKIKNMGRTPAYKVRVTRTIGIIDNSLNPKKADIPESQGDFIILATNEESSPQDTYGVMLNETTYNQIMSGRGKLYFIARVEYEDVFHKKRILYYGSYYDKNYPDYPLTIPNFMESN